MHTHKRTSFIVAFLICVDIIISCIACFFHNTLLLKWDWMKILKREIFNFITAEKSCWNDNWYVSSSLWTGLPISSFQLNFNQCHKFKCNFERNCSHSRVSMNGNALSKTDLWFVCIASKFVLYEISSSNLCAPSKHLHSLIRTMTIFLHIWIFRLPLRSIVFLSFRYNFMKNVSECSKFECKSAKCNAKQRYRNRERCVLENSMCVMRSKYVNIWWENKNRVCVCVSVCWSSAFRVSFIVASTHSPTRAQSHTHTQTHTRQVGWQQ